MGYSEASPSSPELTMDMGLMLGVELGRPSSPVFPLVKISWAAPSPSSSDQAQVRSSLLVLSSSELD